MTMAVLSWAGRTAAASVPGAPAAVAAVAVRAVAVGAVAVGAVAVGAARAAPFRRLGAAAMMRCSRNAPPMSNPTAASSASSQAGMAVTGDAADPGVLVRTGVLVCPLSAGGAG